MGIYKAIALIQLLADGRDEHDVTAFVMTGFFQEDIAKAINDAGGMMGEW